MKIKSKSYEEFVEKFKPKKTTDDCYTPPEVYEVIKDWACNEYNIDPDKVVRPFWPGADYQNFDYSGGKVVIDNPPFSILSKICEWYLEHDVPFFLFAPSLTAFSGAKTFMRINHIICDCGITYENGAAVHTSFLTNIREDIVAQTEPNLTKLVNDAVQRLKREKARQLPKYDYPDNVVTAALMRRYSKYGIDWKISSKDCRHIRQLDAQKQSKKEIFGSGLLLSGKAAAEKAAAGKAAAEKWELSERELAIVAEMSA